jgi:DNA-binding NtrC family response regulator
MARILIVDDEADILIVFQSLLNSEGHEVRTTQSGEEAIQVAQSGKIDLLIVDVRMDPVDGFHILRSLQDSKSEVSVIIVSAYYDANSIELAKILGAFKFLAKPVGMEALIEAVNGAIGA